MRHRATILFPAFLLLSCLAPASMAAGQSAPAKLVDPAADPMMRAAGFLESHPDIRYRLLGLEQYKKQEYAEAMRYFQRAAYYADKPSQGMVAEMLWSGRGAEADRALAYAWMDLAAERGYRGFLGLREQYWKELSESERARAISEGEQVYARYGDQASLPRIATVLRRERLKMTGSRTGFAGNVKIYIPDSDIAIDGSKFYEKRYWDPKQYQAWHDSVWKEPRIANVTVGAATALDADKSSRIPEVAPQQDAPEPETDDAMPTITVDKPTP